jgi:hypothetical protein
VGVLLAVSGRTEQAARKGLLLTEMPEKHTPGAKARIDSIAVMSGINPGPTARTSFLAACGTNKFVPFQGCESL